MSPGFGRIKHLNMTIGRAALKRFVFFARVNRWFTVLLRCRNSLCLGRTKRLIDSAPRIHLGFDGLVLALQQLMASSLLFIPWGLVFLTNRRLTT